MKTSGINELNAVVAVANLRNFRAAAVELNMSASALSHAISTLEEKLGVRLFNRTTRSVSLTEAGEQFLSRVRPALSEISEAMESVTQYQLRPTGLIRINGSEDGIKWGLLESILDFNKKYPEIHIDIKSEGKFVDIVSEGFDAGLRNLEDVPQDMIAIPVGPQEVSFAVVARPDYFKKHSKPNKPADLLEHDCVRFRLPSGLIYRWEFKKNGKKIRMDVKGTLTFSSGSHVEKAVYRGAGIGYLNSLDVRDKIKSGELVRVLEDWMPVTKGLCLYYPKNKYQTLAFKTFVDFLRKKQKTNL